MEVVGHFKEGRNHFVDGSWDRAIQSFEKISISQRKRQTIVDLY